MSHLATALALALVAGAADHPKAAPPPVAPPASTPPAASTAPPATPTERARGAVAKLKGTLVGELQKQIAAAGPAGAIGVCGEAAARIRTEVSSPDLQIGRTSSKLRNPANTAPAWVAPLLAELESAPADKRGPREVKLPNGGLGYVEPLVTQPLCLACHGPTLAPDVKAAVAAKYPQDKAIGYREGDVRGLVWVELKAGALPRP